MQKRPFTVLAMAAPLLLPLLLAACNPTYNWRDYSSPDAPYRIMFPAKPATHTRSVDLNGMRVDLTMTAAEVEGVTFAVGTGVAPDAAQAQAAVAAMRAALVRNIGAKVEHESTADAGVDIDALGTSQGRPMKLRGHFAAHGKRFYQVVVMGKASAVAPEQSDQFLSSFKPL
jgi:hypothetical protein